MLGGRHGGLEPILQTKSEADTEQLSPVRIRRAPAPPPIFLLLGLFPRPAPPILQTPTFFQAGSGPGTVQFFVQSRSLCDLLRPALQGLVDPGDCRRGKPADGPRLTPRGTELRPRV